MRFKARLLIGLIVGVALASVPAMALGVKVPSYKVEVALSAKAAQKLKSSGETVHVAAMYYGTAKPGVDGDDVGQIQMGREDVDIPGAGGARLGMIAIETADLRKIIETEPQLLINIYTSRKVFEDNLLDCGIFQGGISRAARRPIRITCKLIGE